MPLAARLLACLDVTDGRVVKGTRFVDLVDAGDPVELAARYAADGADEIVILDISATREGRPAMIDLIGRAAAALDVPLSVGGGGAGYDDAARLLDAGADKVSINTSIDRDGTRAGYDLELTRAVADAVRVPVIASGGAGSAADVADAFMRGGASAALLASILHLGLITIPRLKAELAAWGVAVRPPAGPITPQQVAAWLG